MMNKIICSLVLAFLVTTVVKAQDPHFSQFYATPLNFNPALTGAIDGTFRINTIYRDQWTSALSDPLQTFSLGADVKFDMPFSKLQRKSDIFGLGIIINSDQVNSFDLNTTSAALSFAYHKSLSQRENKYLTGGLLLGIVQKNINYEDLTFQDQFNTLDGYTFDTGEILPSNNFGYFDLGLGVNYFSNSEYRKVNIGAAVHHLNRPNISFYRNETCPSCIVETEKALDMRYTVYGSIDFKGSETFAISPRVLAMVQGQHKELDLGANFIFKFPTSPGNAFHLGSYIRVVDNESAVNVESIVFMSGIQRKNVIFGFSYDQNVSDLINTRVGLNAFEFSISFVGDHDNNFDVCPKF